MCKKSLNHNRLKPLPRLYLAPLRGFTDHIYRNTYAEHFNGFDLAIAPFLPSVIGNKIRKKYIKGLLPENNTGMPVIPQILSKSAEGFILLANFLYDFGYDTVNWNLGCPYPMVTRKKRGSGLLPHPEMIHEFLGEVIPKIKGNLSIKTRLGLKSRDEIFKLIPIFNQFPIKEIIIHPRTGAQRYEGNTDLDAFDQCLSLIDHPIVYNGDIKCADDFKKLSEKFDRINRWMIGRWSIVNPFLPSIIKTGKRDVENRIKKMKCFHDELFDRYQAVLSGPSHLLNRMKGLWRYFSLPFKDCRNTHKKIKKSRHPDQYISIVDRFFESEAMWNTD